METELKEKKTALSKFHELEKKYTKDIEEKELQNSKLIREQTSKCQEIEALSKSNTCLEDQKDLMV